MLPDPDKARIHHMLEAARQALSFIKDKTFSDLENDAQLRLAILRALEVLGEAANRVSSQTRDAHPEIPWRLVVSTRNRLIHAYFDIDLSIVWTTTTKALPSLVPMLENILHVERP